MTEYKDINFNFSKNTFTSDLNIIEDSSAIKQSIKNILLSFRGERSFKPNFGAELKKFIFESENLVNTTLSLDIIEVLNTYEPRITVSNVTPYYSNGILEIKINYKMKFGGGIVEESTTVTLDP